MRQELDAPELDLLLFDGGADGGAAGQDGGPGPGETHSGETAAESGEGEDREEAPEGQDAPPAEAEDPAEESREEEPEKVPAPEELRRMARQRLGEAQRAAELQRRERFTQATFQRWGLEAEEAVRSYPDFDLGQEVRDPQFRVLLRSGATMKLAYEARHLDAIKDAVAQEAARQREREVIEDIRARGSRPAENSAGAQNAVTLKPDLERMTPEERAEIARRASRGETITLR